MQWRIVFCWFFPQEYKEMRLYLIVYIYIDKCTVSHLVRIGPFESCVDVVDPISAMNLTASVSCLKVEELRANLII
jgi:hypothetical protein